jgi:hypothetical protein
VSRYPEALGLAVKDLTYVAELRGWRGLSLPLLHAVGAVGRVVSIMKLC